MHALPQDGAAAAQNYALGVNQTASLIAPGVSTGASVACDRLLSINRGKRGVTHSYIDRHDFGILKC
jgi:hypothetical protein